MPGELVDAAAILAGSGATKWAADKLLGPSAEALGDQLKAYLNDRLAKIFTRAKQIAPENRVTPLSPGLAMRLIVDASFSADDPKITDWWAGLIADAAVRGSNKHAIFSDMMAMLGPSEAKLLDKVMNGWSYAVEEIDDAGRNNLSSSIELALDHIVSEAVGPLPCTDGRPAGWERRHGALNLTWPSWAVWWALPRVRAGNNIETPHVGSAFAGEDPLTINSLERVGILARRRVMLSNDGYTGWVAVYYITPLGLDFYRASTGRSLKEHNS
ncbi:hypothetical protein [Sphingomonas sp.]|uniref:Abi-alpha family protein n=1 Tax=Sphingomonas sp. TaxID=28214 RepID=UPI002DBD75A0|nr:hypothetical protein [Sphingomonas sp.]HEU4969838.1 hypothetical protein [Sphingomonas sp.]